MPALQHQTSTEPMSPADSTVSAPFFYGDNSPTGNSQRSISELLGLNMPRGTSLGQSSVWSPQAASSPLPQTLPRHQGMRPPCFSPFTSMDSGFSSLDTPPQLRSMPPTNSGGFDLTQPFSPMSPLCTPRAIKGSPPYSDCSSPLEQALLHSWTTSGSRSHSPSDSDSSNISSTDLSDMVNSMSLTQQSMVFSPPTEQELANLRALHSLNSNPALRSMTSPPQFCNIMTKAPAPLDNRHWLLNDNIEVLDKVMLSRFHSFPSAQFLESNCTWSGVLPRRFQENPTFSCKVFLGGVPWDVTEDILVSAFSQFGKVRVEWPGKEQVANQPKGYVYIIFESEKQVKALLSSCTRDTNSNCENWYWRISSRKMKSKEVQVIPWSLADSNFVQTPSQKLDPHTTVFVGALHGMLNAEGLYKIMNDLFGGVVYSGIDTDKFKYPIGSARVTFNNRPSYLKAVATAFIDIKTPKFRKKVQVDPYLEDSPCSCCVVQQGPYFCREFSCFRYFCRSCWFIQHQSDIHSSVHKYLTRSSKNHNTAATVRFTHQ